MAELYNRTEYVAKWAKMLGCKTDEWSVTVHLINVVKNYQTAMALLFGLSWQTDKEYLKKVCKHFHENFKGSDGKDPVATAEWLYQYKEYYIKEVERLPTQG